MTSLKGLLKKIVPEPVLSGYRTYKVSRLRKRNETLSAREVFTGIYENNEWGGRPGEYCSGSGSTEAYSIAYAEIVKRFISENGIRQVVDLGCGNFSVGGQLVSSEIGYVGVDIVEGLIARNSLLFAREGVSFECLDIVEDELPDGELCLIRQVLQHCSNDQIRTILGKLSKYRYVLLTEHYPAPEVSVIPNIDKPHGADTRLINHSAVYLDQPPFNLRLSGCLLEVEYREYVVVEGETLRTLLIEPGNAGIGVHATA